jgi:Undecaprenyl-phosphate glucose phosphotransferase
MSGRSYSKYLRTIYLMFDLAFLNISLLIAYYIVFPDFTLFFEEHNILLFLFFNLTWSLIANYTGLYHEDRFAKSENVIIKLAKTTFFTFALVFAIAFTLKFYLVSRYMIYYSLEIFFILAVGFRVLQIPFFKWYRKAGFNFRNIIIIGAGPVGNEVMKAFTSDVSLGIRFLGFFDDHPENCLHREKVKGKVEDAKEFARQHSVDEVIVALPDFAEAKVTDLIRFCENNMIRIKIVPDFYRHFPHKIYIDFFDSIPLISIRREPLQGTRNRLLKRGFDLLFSTLVILIIFPWLFVVVAILIKRSSPGPVFFRQERSGLNNKVFRMWKFRTMVVNDTADSLQATRQDSRITPVGRILRKTNLDELPQFFNIWKGEMSVVGPRPHMLRHTEEYSQIIENFMVRHMVKPGLTGWAQVTGYRGETGQPELMAKRVEKDVWYIENWSFLLDLQIITMTVKNMITGDENAV